MAKYFSKFQEYPTIQKAFDSIQALTISMILLALTSLYKSGIKDKFQFVIFIVGITAILFFKISPQYIIIVAGVLSLVYKKKIVPEEKNECT